MPVDFHRSCFFVSDAIDGAKPLHKRKKGMRQRSRHARKAKLKALVTEAQIWTLASSLSSELISSDATCSVEMEAITKLTLGAAVEEDFIRTATRKLGLHVLASNEMGGFGGGPHHAGRFSGFKSSPSFHGNQLEMISDGRRPSEDALAELKRLCPEFFERYPGQLTWSDMKSLAKSFPIFEDGGYTWSFRKYVRDWQLWWAECLHGMVGTGTWDRKQFQQLRRKLSFRQLSTLEKIDALGLEHKDHLVVRASSVADGPRVVAYITMDNVITLYDLFWKCKIQTLKQIPMVANSTDIRAFTDSRVSTLIHEATHSFSSIHSRDVTIKLTAAEIRLVSFKVNETNSCTAYGTEAVFLLAQHSTENDDKGAEENADSWAVMCTLRTLQWMYPEFAFLPNLQAWSETRSWEVKRRPELLHHCSLFDCMRHEAAGSILDLPGYDATKDLWGRDTDKKRPKSMDELLGVLVDLARYEEYEQHEKRLEWLRQAARERIKAKKQPRSKRLGLQEGYGQPAQTPQGRQAPSEVSKNSTISRTGQTDEQVQWKYFQQRQKKRNHQRIEKVRTKSRKHARDIKTDTIAAALVVDGGETIP